MSLLPDERQVLDSIISAAYDSHGPVLRDVAVHVVAELHDLEGSGVQWVAQILDDWLVSGALTEVRQWMRRQPAITGRTKGGKPAEVPAFGGVRLRDGSGRVQHVQLRLLDMDLDQLREHMKPLQKQRDTTSRNLSFLAAIADDMEAHAHALVADAVECIGVKEQRRSA